VGEGTLLAHSEVRVTLAPVLCVLGLGAGSLPFKGGVLVPDPDVMLTGLVTDAAGDLELHVDVPAGLAGFTLVEQFWIEDPAAPHRWAASNALSAELR
jgi:hypothetical protein